MSVETWIAFVLAAFVLLVIPGPTLIFVISQAIAYGRRTVLPLLAGVLLGDFTAMTLSLLGLGAVLAASALLFTILKWIGAGYLFYLGFKLWRTKPESGNVDTTPEEASGRSLFRRAYIITALNPKSIAFFVAFLPHFVNPQSPALPQFFILGTTFLVLAGINAGLYALFSGRLRDTVGSARMRKIFDRCGGTALIGAGLFTATMQRS